MSPPSATSSSERPRCAGRTQAGARCRRRARAGSRYCATHAPTSAVHEARDLPADIDVGELQEAIDSLDPASATGAGRSSGAGGSSRHRPRGGGTPDDAGPLHELREVTDMLGDNAARLCDAAISAGIVEAGVTERLASDLAAALGGLAKGLAERAAGDYEEDDFGFDERFTMRLLPLATLLYRYWWRVDVTGIQHVPARGRGLLVSNHAGGGVPFDGAMIKAAMMLEHPSPRHVRLLVLDWLMGLPWLADLMKKTGQVLACAPNALELLRRDELVAVFPEGVKGMAKPFSRRYNLERFGRGGFVRIALRTRSPIIPVAVVGSEEIYPKIANMPLAHRLLGTPFVPVTPTFPLLGPLGLLPLPSKWHIEFCEPIDVSSLPPEAADDRAFVLEVSERVRETIQERLRANLLLRRTPFW